jgi:hypothetical protein
VGFTLGRESLLPTEYDVVGPLSGSGDSGEVISKLYQESNHDSSVPHPVALALYRYIYPG